MARWKAKSAAIAASPRAIAASILPSATAMRWSWLGERRSAARPAAKISMLMRNSMMRRISCSDLSPSGSMRKGRRWTSLATKAPTPWRVMTSPSERSAETASRITVRLTPKLAIIACAVGSRAPGASLPVVISAASRSTSFTVRFFGGASGRRPCRKPCSLLDRAHREASREAIHEDIVDHGGREARDQAGRHERAPEIDVASHQERWYADPHRVLRGRRDEGDRVDELLKHQRE